MDTCSSAFLSALVYISVQFKRRDTIELTNKKWYRLLSKSAPLVPAIQAAVNKHDLVMPLLSTVLLFGRSMGAFRP